MNPFEFSVGCEVFGIARGEVLASMARPRWYDLRVVAEQPGRPVPTPFGFGFTVERGLDDLVAADTVIVPMAPRPADAERQRAGWRMPTLPGGELLDALRQASAKGARMVSFCSGAFVLAEAGLLDGRRATTHWTYLETFRHRYPRVEVVPDVLHVDGGDVLTSAGSASAVDLSLHIVRQDHGDDAADLARRADMSDRTFARRFREATGTTPHQWLTRQRVSRARQLLETTDWTVDAVAARSGLGTAANLRARLRET